MFDAHFTEKLISSTVGARKGRSLSSLAVYVSFMHGSAHRRRTLMSSGAIGAAPRTRSHPMDFVYLGVGAALFALFAIYAVLLRRV
jgi:hypothetical protein